MLKAVEEFKRRLNGRKYSWKGTISTTCLLNGKLDLYLRKLLPNEYQLCLIRYFKWYGYKFVLFRVDPFAAAGGRGESYLRHSIIKTQ